MRTSLIVLAAAGAALAQNGYVSQIPDGQIQAPTETAPAATETAPVATESEVAPTPYTSVPAVSAPPELSSVYSAPAAPSSLAPVPLPSAINNGTSAGPVAPPASYPAGNGTVVAPTGSGVPTTVKTTAGGSPTGGSPTSGYGSQTSAGAVGGSQSAGAPASSQTGNGAGIVGIETGVIFAGLLAFFA